MTIAEILNNTRLKQAEKAAALSQLLLEEKSCLTHLIRFAGTAKDAVKATCIESMEYASKQNPRLINTAAFGFVVANLAAEAPRVKWESARVVGNTAHLFKENLADAIAHLLQNTRHEGTVVRWSAAFALGEIIKLKTIHNKTLISTAERLVTREEKNSIRKIYLSALKKAAE